MKDLSKCERYFLTNSQLAINCVYVRSMKIQYESEDIREKMVKVSKEHPDLYRLYSILAKGIKAFDHYEFTKFIESELSKGRNNKEILVKQMQDSDSYEFRIPPHDKGGVMRVMFQIVGNYYEICITDVIIKGRNNKTVKRRGKRRLR